MKDIRLKNDYQTDNHTVVSNGTTGSCSSDSTYTVLDVSKLVEFCLKHGPAFGEKLMIGPNYLTNRSQAEQQQEDEEKQLRQSEENNHLQCLKIFFELALPHMVYSTTYMVNKTCQPISSIATTPEECFAMMIFENHFKRWVYEAHSTMCKQYKEHKMPEYVDMEPLALYQQNTIVKKTNARKVGKWKSTAIERLNTLCKAHLKMKSSKERARKEEELLSMFKKDKETRAEGTIQGKKKKEKKKKARQEEKPIDFLSTLSGGTTLLVSL